MSIWENSLQNRVLNIIMSQRKTKTRKTDVGGTPTKVGQPSPSHAYPSRSPLTASKFSNQRQAVSYGQLQTVLENIQQIRKKANQQIIHLTAQNEGLREELIRCQHDYEELQNRITKSSYSKHEFESKIIEQLETTEVEKKALELELKEREKMEVGFEAKSAQLQRNVDAERSRCSELERKIEDSAARWKWAFEILAGSADRSEQLIWKVKGDYPDGVWSVFDSNSQLQRREELANNKMEMLESELSEMRVTARKNTSLLEKSLDQLSNVNAKLDQAEQQIGQLRRRIAEIESQGERKTAQYKSKLASTELAIKVLEEKLVQAARDRELGSRDLVKRVAELEENLQAREKELQEHKRSEEYAALVSSVCDQSADYSVLLQRVRYLQRFKAQHYLNVEKLQFLCKQLDY